MNDGKKFQVNEVFGVSRSVPLNYVPREKVDHLLINQLGRHRHIVIHGGSKQGKTCVRKRCFGGTDIVVQCMNKWTLADLHKQILKRIGYEIVESRTSISEKKDTGTLEFEGKVLGVGLKFQGENGKNTGYSETFRPLSIDFEDPNDLIGALDAVSFERHIVLEDFHYLSESTQRDFAVCLKAYHESSNHCFVIVGVWLEEDRITAHNGDLTGRVISINADEWSKSELREVACSGAQLLNVEFDDKFLSELVDASFGSVSVVQEACAALCQMHGVNETCDENKVFGGGDDARAVIEKVVRSHGVRYRAFLKDFSEGLGKSRFELHRWLLYPVVMGSAHELEFGVLLKDLKVGVLASHPESHAISDRLLVNALEQVTAVQAHWGIVPPVLDWDSVNERLSIVDRGFLIWLDGRSKHDLIGYCGLGRFV